MDDLWETMRMVNFIILFASFVIGVYKAVLKNITHSGAFNWDRFMNMAWTILSLYSLGEILYITGIAGGPRIFLSTGVMLLQLWVVIFKYGDPKQPESRLVQSYE
jgi:hypothetical protein